MADIFLSYAKEDRAIAQRISETLERAGWSVWWDREIPAGQTWRDVLEQALTNMRCMVVLWSAHSIKSSWVKDEAEEGQAVGKLVPILIENVKPPIGFRAIQAADMIAWDGSENFLGFKQLIAALESALGKPEKKSTTATTVSAHEKDRQRTEREPSFEWSKLGEWAGRLPWWSYAAITVIITMLITAVIRQEDRTALQTYPASLPVKTLDAGELKPAATDSTRPKANAPAGSATQPMLNPTTVPSETKPAKRVENTRPRSTRIPSHTPNSSRCAEILTRAQLGEPLTDADREALRKECQ